MTGANKASVLFEATALRVAVDGAVSIEAFDLTTEGERLVLACEVTPLLSLLTNVPIGAASLARSVLPADAPPEGLSTVASGSLRIFGADVARGAHLGLVGSAPIDPPLPLDFSALEFVSWSGRLAGLGGGAKGRAIEALAKVGLGKAEKRVLRTFSVPERRALMLAHAIVASPRVIVAETPLADLEGHAAAFVLAALTAAAEDRAAIVSMRRTSTGTAEGTFASTATDLAFFSRGELLVHGSAAALASGGRLYGLTVRSNAEALHGELSRRGIELRGGPLRFSATLPEGTDTRDILAAASVTRSAVVELLSLM